MNNDLVYRQQAIDLFNDSAELLRRVLDDTDIVGAERKIFEWELRLTESYISDLKELPSAQQWIPCSERPPEKEGVYFVTFSKSCLLENELPVMDAIWRDGQWQYGVLESYEHRMPKLVIEPIGELKVIAWMPLPEPYKGADT